jgi:hypothetical protein
MFVVTQLCFQIVEEINYMFRPFSGWAIIRLRLQYRRKLVYYNVDIKNGGTRSRFTILRRCVAIYTRCGICTSYDFICRVFCRFIDTWAGVVFRSCFGKRWSVRSWLGRLRRWWLWRRQVGLWSNCLRKGGEGGLDVYIGVYECSPIFESQPDKDRNM